MNFICKYTYIHAILKFTQKESTALNRSYKETINSQSDSYVSRVSGLIR